ncbi:MAG: GalNAc(5)-diNAcBac-PP-undecaprenol beta-1,3-glucosyltransferase [candidate division WS6 bacterium OLB20]|uniref:GalNAc(5)-diNAcBac-PP-undecaprenol beta-1,3-glucosyltransferase n=1 Tax=candidate division WS6 bacterium OLB20 TaxID=1617426 RepID=A0A136LYQ9_9BACT|nr:MAG: GalNAc(5)-diNAcBac-PP-undecaprenol beta-1,3-glucosyltransferase [candidate division WS6 bacterium OLB20]
MAKPKITVIVPTYNSAATLEACLRSIQAQTWNPVELIVADNNSSDATRDIARQYGTAFIAGPERSAQRNQAARRAAGDILIFIDSDMVLDRDVVTQVAEAFSEDPGLAAVVIPEETVGRGFWPAVRRFERGFYEGVSWIEAARAFPRQVFEKTGGYNEDMISGEDWDLAKRAAASGRTGRIAARIRHDETGLTLWKHLKKKYYYSRNIGTYRQSADDAAVQFNPLRRLFVFMRKPFRLITRPHLTWGLFTMKLLEMVVYTAARTRSGLK